MFFKDSSVQSFHFLMRGQPSPIPPSLTASLFITKKGILIKCSQIGFDIDTDIEQAVQDAKQICQGKYELKNLLNHIKKSYF